jgi:hypothetical protein
LILLFGLGADDRLFVRNAEDGGVDSSYLVAVLSGLIERGNNDIPRFEPILRVSLGRASFSIKGTPIVITVIVDSVSDCLADRARDDTLRDDGSRMRRIR